MVGVVCIWCVCVVCGVYDVCVVLLRVLGVYVWCGMYSVCMICGVLCVMCLWYMCVV